MMICPHCQSQQADGTAFCGQCGQPMTVAAPAAPVAAKAPIDFKKFIKPGIAVVAVIAVVIVLFSVLGGGAAATGFLYVQDGEGFFLEKAGAEGWQYTGDLNSSLLSDSIVAGGNLFYLDRGDSLYYRPADDPEGEAVKLCSDVDCFFVNQAGSQVVIDADNHALYFHDLDEKTKICSKNEGFIFSPQGDVVLYLDDEGGMYWWEDGEKTKIASDADRGLHINQAFDTITFESEDDEICRWTKSDEMVTLFRDATLYQVYEDGSFYYIDEDDQFSYYTGDTIALATDVRGIRTFSDQPMAIFEADDTYYVAVEGTLTTLAFSEEIKDFTFAEDGSAIYLTANVDDSHGDLYKIAISGSTAEEPTLYDTDVYYSITCSGADVMYYKNHTDKSSDLYRNGEMIATDVYSKTVTEDGTVYLRTDYDNGSYTLSVYDGSLEKIADDVHSFVVADNGEVAFLADWSSSRDKGTLYTWDGGDPEKIAEDVSKVTALGYSSDDYRSNVRD